MKFAILASLTVLLLAGCSETPPAAPLESESGQTPAADPVATLSAEELARSLRIVWYEVTLPGSPEDQWEVGPVIEFGDGTDAKKAGSTSPIPGGTVVKLFARPEGDRLSVSVLGPTFSTQSQMDLPAGWERGAQMFLSGKVDSAMFLIKGTENEAGVDSSTTLKPGEYGLRLRLEKIESPST
ncbi:MAG: hypothetical protein JNJ70_01185 [Verrucomicrobiales bacterium]|nr:hypothetical protein [Verrucomicrobiales bacterium]